MLKAKYEDTTTTQRTTDDDFNQAVMTHLRTFGKSTTSGPTNDEINFHKAVYAHLTGNVDTPTTETTSTTTTTDDDDDTNTKKAAEFHNKLVSFFETSFDVEEEESTEDDSEDSSPIALMSLWAKTGGNDWS